MDNNMIDIIFKHWKPSDWMIGLGRMTEHNLHMCQSKHIRVATTNYS